MLAFLFNLSIGEIGMLLVVAILVFGRRLPEVAGQAAATLQKLRRNLNELRRETGIDAEFRSAQRTIRESVKLDLDTRDVGNDLLNQAGLDPETRNVLARPLEDPRSASPDTIETHPIAEGQFSRDPHDPTLPSTDRREPDSAEEENSGSDGANSSEPGDEGMPVEERLRSQGIDPSAIQFDGGDVEADVETDVETDGAADRDDPDELSSAG